MVPPALGRLSTTTCWPQLSIIFSPTQRARMSVWLPAENGTSMRIGLAGNFSCAVTAPAANSSTDATVIFFTMVMIFSSVCRFLNGTLLLGRNAGVLHQLLILRV